MRTFEEYIREGVDFRLGGSWNKGLNQAKTFDQLEEGDIIYYYWESKPAWSKCVEAFIFLKFADSIFYDSKVEMTFIRKKANKDEWGFFSLEKDELANSILIRDEEKHFSILTTNKDEFLTQVKEHTGKAETEIEIENFTGKKLDEAYNFRLGGNQQKGFNQAKTFRELEEGDVFYYAVYDTRAEMNYALYYARQYTFHRRWNDGSRGTKLFITIKGNTNSYFDISNKDLDSTLSMIESDDLCRHIISTDKNEFLGEVNKATNGNYSEKDIDIIE